MSNNQGFDKSKKVIIAIVEMFIYHYAMVISFYIRYDGELPFFNYIAYVNIRNYILLAFVLLNILFGVYIYYNKSNMDLMFLTAIVQFILTIIVMATTFYGRWFTFPRSVIAISYVISTLMLFVFRTLVFKLYGKIDGSKKVMVVGQMETVKESVANFENAKNRRHKVTHAVTGHFFENVKKQLDQVDIVYLANGIEHSEKMKLYDLLVRERKNIFVSTNFENLVLVNPNIMNIEDESVIEVSNFQISPEFDLVKRLFDMIISGFLILLASPIMLVAAVLVKVTSKGPVIYKQVRITKNQQPFNIYKFRTMSATAEAESGPVLASANDMRVTSLGKYLRALRIDELPQLFNVLNGTMSLVGPRPERPFFVEQFVKENPYYDLRHNVRAGITGYAQVNGKYSTNFNSKLNFDLVYIKNYNVLLDLKILLQTLKVLFDKVSSKGLDEQENQEWKLPETIKVYE